MRKLTVIIFAILSFQGFGQSLNLNNNKVKIGNTGKLIVDSIKANNAVIFPDNTIQRTAVGMDSAGNVALGNEIVPQEKLTVAGRIRTTNSDIAIEDGTRGILMRSTGTDTNWYRVTIVNGALTLTSTGSTTIPTE